MLDRRNVIIGLPLLAAAGAAYALTPRRQLNLLGRRNLEAEIPLELGAWGVTPSNAVILPKAQEGSLSARLYDQTVSRLYTSPTRRPVALVIAYGSTQSDQLQLHRPEVCYQAVGFGITYSRVVDVSLANGAVLPARLLVASTNERTDPILYWTRIGDFLPTSGEQQRLMKLRGEMHGYVADGVLVRLSTFGEATEEAFDALKEFARLLVHSVSRDVLPALVGRPLAARLG